MSKHKVEIEQFQGPLDVLLQLIEEQELQITDISLAEITDSFVQYLDKIEQSYPDELADFLVIATRLLYIKSRALLPFLEPEKEESESNLAEHLKMYKEFRDAADALAGRVAQHNFSMARPVTAKQLEMIEFSPPTEVTPVVLEEAYRDVIERIQTIIKIPKAAIRKALTLKDRINALSKLLDQHKKVSFNEIIGEQRDRTEIVVTFLAVLELLKQQHIIVRQQDEYSDILITQAKS
ncbi:MAG: segregation/condensation protein A [bacterium]|nr:segregation/condensation protein A [bacterium]